MHDRESAVSASPERKAHDGWREFSTFGKVFIVKALLEVMLPEEESQNGEETQDEEGDYIWGGDRVFDATSV